jgi:hypothetical protein
MGGGETAQQIAHEADQPAAARGMMMERDRGHGRAPLG